MNLSLRMLIETLFFEKTLAKSQETFSAPLGIITELNLRGKLETVINIFILKINFLTKIYLNQTF